MDRIDRFQKLHRVLKSGNYHTIVGLADFLECSPDIVKRDIKAFKELVDAPIFYDRARKGYRYLEKEVGKFELPGLWLTASEIQGLTVMLAILKSMDNSLLADDLDQVEQALKQILKNKKINAKKFEEKIQYLPSHKKTLNSEIFNRVAQSVLQGKQLEIRYSDFIGRKTERLISPQKIVHYQSNWYVDAWCHLRNDLRSFAVSRIQQAEVQKEKIKSIPKTKLTGHFTQSYGIFAGKAKHQAEILFYPQVAKEVAAQQWHPDQKGEWVEQQGQKAYMLSFPYSDDRELVRDILAYGNNAEVLKPAKLKNKIRNILRGMWDIYK